jgi:hypothetical protein
MKHSQKFLTSLGMSRKILFSIWYYWCHVHDLIFKEGLDDIKRYEKRVNFACNVKMQSRYRPGVAQRVPGS